MLLQILLLLFPLAMKDGAKITLLTLRSMCSFTIENVSFDQTTERMIGCWSVDEKAWPVYG